MGYSNRRCLRLSTESSDESYDERCQKFLGGGEEGSCRERLCKGAKGVSEVEWHDAVKGGPKTSGFGQHWQEHVEWRIANRYRYWWIPGYND